MDLSLFRALLEVAKWQSFTKAAEMLGYAQSSVTAQIQRLEADYGVEVFERIGKRMKLTPAGEALLQYAEKLLALYEESKITVTGQTSGSFIIGTHEITISSYMLPPYLGSFKAHYPQVQVVLREVPENDIFRALKAGECDLGFVVDRELTDPDLRFEIIKEEQYVVIASPQHPLASRSSIVPEDLNGSEVIMSGSGHKCRNLFESMLRSRRIQYTLTYEINNFENVKKCVMNDLGISLIPSSTIMSELEKGQLAVLPLDYPDFKMLAQLCYHAKKHISHPMRAFIESMCGSEATSRRNHHGGL